LTTRHEHYAEVLRTGQEFVNGAIDSWARAAHQAFVIGPPAPLFPADVTGFIDQGYDLAEKVLASQRRFAKTLVEASSTATKAVADQVESVTETAVKKTAEATKAATAKAATSKPAASKAAAN
jgi:hypothetical protein